MKKNVSLGGYSLLISVIILAVFISGGLYAWKVGNTFMGYVIMFCLAVLCVAGLLYMPLSIKITENDLRINRSLWIKSLPLAGIESVKLCNPSMGAIRICGSSGYMGYWGWFRDRNFGKYFAYYGNASDCFLVTMKDGRKYMLGCKDAPEMVAAIQSKLQ